MPVAHRGVGNQQPLLRQHPVGQPLCALALEDLAGAVRRLAEGLDGRARQLEVDRRARTARGLGVAVDGDVGDVGKDLRRPVATGRELEQVGRRVDELGRIFVRQKDGVFQQVDDEVDVRAHPPDAELAQRPVHPLDRHFRRLGAGRHLGQQAVVEPGDDGAGIGGAAVEPDAGARGRAVGADPAVIGNEVVLRILGRHPALQGMAVQRHIVLRRTARRLDDTLALGDHDLRAHDVDAGHFFRYRMLDLHARVYLDEIELALVHIHQEFDRARAFVVDVRAQLLAEVADLLALRFRQIGGGGALDDLLVAPLDRAVALPQVIDVALLVAEDLHLDVPRAQDHLLEIALAVAECRLRLAPPLADLLLEFAFVLDRPHAPSAAAPGRLEHQRIADLGGLRLHLLHVLAQHLGRRDHRHARLDGDAPRAGLVAKLAHGLCLRSDEGDARGIAGIDERGVLAQQAVTGMDRIGARHLCHADDLVDAQIGGHRPQTLADPVGLVRLVAVQAELVLFGIDRDRALAHLVGRPHDPDRDLAPVGDEDLLEVGHPNIPPGRTLLCRCSKIMGIPRDGQQANAAPVCVPVCVPVCAPVSIRSGVLPFTLP